MDQFQRGSPISMILADKIFREGKVEVKFFLDSHQVNRGTFLVSQV